MSCDSLEDLENIVDVEKLKLYLKTIRAILDLLEETLGLKVKE